MTQRGRVVQPTAGGPGSVPRALRVIAALACLLWCVAAVATPRVVTLDWGIAQNLVALGVAPIGVGQVAGYRSWVAGPPLPSDTREIGLRSQPNMELLAQLDPDRIFITELYAGQAQRLSSIAPVSSVDVYFSDGDVWDNTLAAVTKLGRLVDRDKAAKALIARSRRQIARQADRVPADTRPLLMLQFVDESHVRVYGDGSLVVATARRMGLDNAWHGATTRWGMAMVPISRLADIDDARVIVMGPVPVGVADKIADNRVWQALPAVRQAPPVFLPAVWSFGGLPSATRFAHLIADALTRAPDTGPGWPRARPTP